MKRSGKARHLVLISGGGAVEGPISRLGLADRLEPVKRWPLALIWAGKLILLASVLYYFLAD